MANMDRRDFLLAALSGLGGLGLAGCADAPGLVDADGRPMGQIDPSPVPIARICNNVRTRKNIYCLNESSPDVISYRLAVDVMMNRPASDPTSWEAQRAMHWTNLFPQTSLFNLCEHGTFFFLSWHRMYLYWFERIVRAAANDSAFALPYWGYSPTGTRNLPAPFRVPASSTNVLYTSSRGWGINSGNHLASSLVDPGLALAELAFIDFQDALESTPHDGVHNPGVGGWMGSVSTAALDPVFYLHHCNIDRLWEVWLALGGGRANPTDPAWLNATYQFYNEQGATVNMTGAQIVQTANQLCYRYASPRCLAVATSVDEESRIFAPGAGATAVSEPIASRPPRTSPYTLADEQAAVELGAAPVTVTVPIPAETRHELRAFPDAREGNRLELLLRDVALKQEPALFYEVYVNLPGDAREAEYTSPHYVGNLSFFSLTMPKTHEGHGFTRRLNLLRVYAYLRSRDEWTDEAVRVTFVPRGGTEGDDPARLLTGTQATVGRISLQLR